MAGNSSIATDATIRHRRRFAFGVNTWLMKGFFDTVPRDIDESARVDGAGHARTFFTLILPLVTPIIAVVGMLSYIATANEYLIARTCR